MRLEKNSMLSSSVLLLVTSIAVLARADDETAQNVNFSYRFSNASGKSLTFTFKMLYRNKREMVTNISAEMGLKSLPKAGLNEDILSLNSLEKQGVVTIFNKAICRLSIIQNILPKFQSKKSKRYCPLPQQIDELQTLILPEDQLSDKTMVLKHVHQYCYFLQHLLKDTAQEVLYEGTWHHLQDVLSCDKLKTYNEIILKNENNSIKQTIQELHKKIVHVKKNFKETHHYLSNINRFCLERALVNSWAQTESFLKYTDLKLGARSDLIKYELNEKEYNLQKTIHETFSNLEEDDKISNEILNFMSTSLKTPEELQSLADNYNEQVDKFDIEILLMNNKLESQREQYQKMLDLYNSRKIEVEEMQRVSDEIDRKLELKLKQTKAAIKIQTWWRKILFMKMKKEN